MILNNISDLIFQIEEGHIWNVVKGQLHNVGELGSSSLVINSYVRDELAKEGINISPKEADELVRSRGEAGAKFGIPAAIIMGILGSIPGIISANPVLMNAGANLGGMAGYLTGSILARARENKKFIENKKR